jgi:hypothetical protein
LSLWDQPIGKDVGTVYLRREGRVEVLIWEFKGVLRISPEVAMGELLDGEWWGKDGVREWGAAVLDLLEAGRKGTAEDPAGVGVYFRDIDPSTTLLHPELSRALRLLHDVVAGPYDLVKHHPPIHGVTGNRVSGALRYGLQHCKCAVPNRCCPTRVALAPSKARASLVSNDRRVSL